jgi:hypothetical protein
MRILRQWLLLISLLPVLGFGMEVCAFEGPHRVMDWSELLDLSSKQQAEIARIETGFRQHFQQLRDESIPRWGQGFDEQQWLKQRAQERELEVGMRKQLQQVLTEAQRLQADTIVQRFHRKATAEMLERMVQELALSPAQWQRLEHSQAAITADFDWPMDHSQMEAARIGIEKLLSNVLTPEQLAEVQQQQRRREKRKRWPKPEDFRDGPGKGGARLPWNLPSPPEPSAKPDRCFDEPAGNSKFCQQSGSDYPEWPAWEPDRS